MDSSRISLRPFKLSDVNDFLKWASDDRVTRYLRWNSITTKEDARTYLENVVIPHPWRRSICLDDRSIRYISIKPESGDDDRCRARIGYAVAEEYWGQGIMTMALKLAISKVFEDMRELLVRLEALVEVENKGSQRLADADADAYRTSGLLIATSAKSSLSARCRTFVVPEFLLGNGGHRVIAE
ncbi:hypothetical protein EZV62_000658 [Acer yangbiense]|uniref:N-acetyltransferase domain-containing protein n=1 Tax=Acer yangbiense TaxID=1000413 RepID=A0A5C7ISK6_9ROSI|nr:hypothetical protein EZV62_000658 [Acer yangbiense]